MARTRITNRRWHENQRLFIKNFYPDEYKPELIETYEEDGLLIRRYQTSWPKGVAPQYNLGARE